VEILHLIASRLGRWAAYADSCLNAESELARCQGFWNGVAGLFAVICVILLAAVISGILRERQRGRLESSRSKYRPKA
jgi:hypothetical protein